MTTTIYVVTEGATERIVGKVLHERGILSGKAQPRPPQWRGMSGREGFNQVMQSLTNELLPTLCASGKQERLLLVVDQDDAATPQDRANLINQALSLQLQPYNPQQYDNLFMHDDPSLRVMLHVSNATIPGITRKDFDGYLLMLLQGQNKPNLVQHLAKVQAVSNTLLYKAEQAIPQLMQQNGIPWTHAKSWLYAYITVFHYRQSHVWFAEEIVQHADAQDLRHVFSSLIAAWEALI